jgi:hypothetical protein
MRVLDMCAAPGGKTAALAALMQASRAPHEPDHAHGLHVPDAFLAYFNSSAVAGWVTVACAEAPLSQAGHARVPRLQSTHTAPVCDHCDGLLLRGAGRLWHWTAHMRRWEHGRADFIL